MKFTSREFSLKRMPSCKQAGVFGVKISTVTKWVNAPELNLHQHSARWRPQMNGTGLYLLSTADGWFRAADVACRYGRSVALEEQIEISSLLVPGLTGLYMHTCSRLCVFCSVCAGVWLYRTRWPVLSDPSECDRLISEATKPRDKTPAKSPWALLISSPYP